MDVAEPGLAGLLRSQAETRLRATGVKVDVRSLHAGTQCCTSLPALHYQEPGYTYRQGTPAVQEDIVIPWEGKRLLDAVKTSLPKLKPGAPVKLLARVSEGPEQRAPEKSAPADAVRCRREKQRRAGARAYKPGVSWLMDEIAPRLRARPLHP